MPNENKAPEPKKVEHRMWLEDFNVSDSSFAAIRSDIRDPVTKIEDTYECGTGWKFKPSTENYRALGTGNIVEIVPVPAHCVSDEFTPAGSE